MIEDIEQRIERLEAKLRFRKKQEQIFVAGCWILMAVVVVVMFNT